MRFDARSAQHLARELHEQVQPREAGSRDGRVPRPGTGAFRAAARLRSASRSKARKPVFRCPTSMRLGSPSLQRSAMSGSCSSSHAASTEQLPVVLYMHGGGWIFGSASSHGRLAAELAVASVPRSPSSSTRSRPKRSTPCRSSSATRSLAGSQSKATRTGSTRHVSRSPVTQPAGTWRRCSASWRSSAAT